MLMLLLLLLQVRERECSAVGLRRYMHTFSHYFFLYEP
jgi:hypothetical protein